MIQGDFAMCDNNCKGVNPNAIIGAWLAAVSVAGIAASSILGPMTGLVVGGS